MERTRFFSTRTLICLLPATAVSLLCALLLTLLSAALLALGVPDGWVGPFSFVTVTLSALAGGFCAGRKGKEAGLATGALTGLTLALLHLGLTLLVGEISLSLLLFSLGEVLGGGVGGILGVNLRR